MATLTTMTLNDALSSQELLKSSVRHDNSRAPWFVVIRGRARGPMTLARVVDLATRGHLTRRTYAWRQGMAKWQPLSFFPGLIRILGPERPKTEPVIYSSTARTAQVVASDSGSTRHRHGDTTLTGAPSS